MTSACFPHSVARICGPEKLRVDPKTTPAQASVLPITIPPIALFGQLEGLHPSPFDASPGRFALQNLSALV